MAETKRHLKVFLCHTSADKPAVRNLWECLKQWANEIHDMRSIVWKTLPMKLPAVETEDE